VKKKSEWGDVLAALPSSSSRRIMENPLIKAEVVERFPASRSGSRLTPSPKLSKADSDDEEETFGSHIHSDSESELEEEEVREDGFDLDDALHQQEIAAEYYSRREDVIINKALTEATETSAISSNSGPWDKEHVPLDATLARAPPASRQGSRFKTSRQQPFASQSIDGSVLPASMLRGAVRMGKLENGNLVEEGDSENESTADVEERLAIESTKRKLLDQVSGSELPNDPSTPVQANMRSSPKLHQDEDAKSQQRLDQQAILSASSSLASRIAPGSGLNSMIVESPAFSATPSSKTEIARETAVMSETVQESVPRQESHRSPLGVAVGSSKVSRFKASRS